jgi:hypothetical protein
MHSICRELKVMTDSHFLTNLSKQDRGKFRRKLPNRRNYNILQGHDSGGTIAVSQVQ